MFLDTYVYDGAIIANEGKRVQDNKILGLFIILIALGMPIAMCMFISALVPLALTGIRLLRCHKTVYVG